MPHGKVSSDRRAGQRPISSQSRLAFKSISYLMAHSFPCRRITRPKSRQIRKFVRSFFCSFFLALFRVSWEPVALSNAQNALRKSPWKNIMGQILGKLFPRVYGFLVIPAEVGRVWQRKEPHHKQLGARGAPMIRFPNFYHHRKVYTNIYKNSFTVRYANYGVLIGSVQISKR
jgi:hypothetical protein